MALSPANSRGVNGVTVTDTPSAGEVLTADSATAASWQAASGGLAVLFNSTLGADAAAIDSGAGGIAQTSTSLVIRAMLRTTEAVAVSTALIRVNGSVGTNYDTARERDLNTTVSGAVIVGGTSWTIDCASANSLAAVCSFVYMEIPFYTAINFLKGGLIVVGTGGDTGAEMFVEVYGCTFRSAGAITQISVTAGGGNLLAGSRLQVLGSV